MEVNMMDVDFYEGEIVVYLTPEIIRDLKVQGSLYREIKEMDLSNNTEKEITVDLQYHNHYDDSGEYFDDVIDALEEVDSMLWELSGTINSFEDIKNDYQWKKVMRTYEHYDNIRNQYE